MRVERIPTLGDNYTYLIIDPATNEAAVVDAPESDPVIRRVDALGVNVTKVLCTHHHPDHCGANSDLTARFDAPVYAHSSDSDRIPGFKVGLEEGDRLRVGNLEAEILFIPAHTRGHIAYAFPDGVFCGDTLFSGGCGRIFEGDARMMNTALNEKLARLDDDVLVYCGHEYTESNLRFAVSVEPGNAALARKVEWVRERRCQPASDWHDATESEMTIPSTIAEERATNPFLRVDSPEIIASVQQRHPDAATDPVTVLGHLRAMKDSF